MGHGSTRFGTLAVVAMLSALAWSCSQRDAADADVHDGPGAVALSDLNIDSSDPRLRSTITLTDSDVGSLRGVLSSLLDVSSIPAVNATILVHPSSPVPAACDTGPHRLCAVLVGNPPLSGQSQVRLLQDNNPASLGRIALDRNAVDPGAGGNNVPLTLLYGLILPDAVGFDITERSGGPGSPPNPNAGFRVLTSLVPPLFPNQEVQVRFQPDALALRTVNGRHGLWMPVALDLKDPAGAPWTPDIQCVRDENGFNPNRSTMPGPFCLELIDSVNAGIRNDSVVQTLLPLLTGGTITARDLFCDGYRAQFTLRRLRVWMGIEPRVVNGCDNTPFGANTPTELSQAWMNNVPFGRQYRQGCLRVLPRAQAVPAGQLVPGFPGPNDDFELQAIQRLECSTELDTVCGILGECGSGVVNAICVALRAAFPGGLPSCSDISFERAETLVPGRIAEGATPPLEEELARLLGYQGGALDAPPQGPGCDPQVATCTELINSDFVPASLTKLAFGWFANAFASNTTREEFPITAITPECPPGSALVDDQPPEVSPFSPRRCLEFTCRTPSPTEPDDATCMFDVSSGLCLSPGPFGVPIPCVPFHAPVADGAEVPMVGMEFEVLVDPDGDGLTGPADTCPFVGGNLSGDNDDPDADGYGRVCDPCPCSPTEDGLTGDGDGDGICDVCDPSSGDGVFCGSYCADPANAPDNCVGTTNPDQANCNEEAELTAFPPRNRIAGTTVNYTLPDPHPNGRVRGDACDPVPCAVAAAESEILAIDQGAGACNSDTVPFNLAPCLVSTDTRIRFNGVRDPGPEVPGTSRFAYCLCDAPHITIDERIRNCTDPSFGCVAGDASAFPTATSAGPGWQSITTTARAVPNQLSTPGTLASALALPYTNVGYGFPTGPSNQVRWRFERDFATFDICEFAGSAPDPLPPGCRGVFVVPPGGVDNSARPLRESGVDGVPSVNDVLQGVGWSFTPDIAGVPTLGVVRDRASDYFRLDVNAKGAVGMLISQIGLLPHLSEFDPCTLFFDPQLCLGPRDLDTPQFDPVGPWIFVADAIDPASQFGITNGMMTQAEGAFPPNVAALLAEVNASVAFVAVSESSSLLRARRVSTRGVAVDQQTGSFLAEFEESEDGGIRIRGASEDLPCQAGTIQVRCELSTGGSDSVPITRCSIPCNEVPGDNPDEPGVPDDTCRLIDTSGFELTDESACASSTPPLLCGAGKILCEGADGPTCAVPCDGVSECTGAVRDEGPAACGGLGMSARALSGLLRRLFVVSNDDGGGEVLTVLDLASGATVERPFRGAETDATPLSMVYRPKDDSLYLLDRLEKGHGYRRKSFLRVLRISRLGDAEELTRVRIHRHRKRTAYHLTNTHDGMLLLTASGPKYRRAFYAVLEPTDDGVLVLERFLDHRVGEVVLRPDSTNPFAYAVALRVPHIVSFFRQGGTVRGDLSLTEVRRGEFKRLRRPRQLRKFRWWL